MLQRFIPQLCFIACLACMACGTPPDVFFYANKPPLYNSALHVTRRNADLPTSIQDITVLIYGSNYNARRAAYNDTLTVLSEKWNLCSGGKSSPFNVTFQNVVSFPNGCHPDINDFNANRHYIQLLAPTQCIPEDSLSIGHGYVDYPLVVIYESTYTNAIRLTAHELGHTMGLKHASRLDDEYGDPSCVMGFVDGGLSQREACFNAPHMKAIGWSTPQEIKKTEKIFLRSDVTYTYTIDGDFYFQFIKNELYIYKSDVNENNWDTKLLQILGPGVQTFNFISFQLFLNYETNPPTAEIIELGTYPKTKSYNYALFSAAILLCFLLLLFIFV